MILDCPACSVPIADLSGPGSEDVICPRCRYGFRAISGKLVASASRSVTVRSDILRHATDKQLYEVQIDQLGVRKVIAFEVESTGRTVVFAPGDLISFVYLLRAGEVDQLLRIVNHTSGTLYELATAGDNRRRLAGWLGTTAGAVSFVLIAMVLDPGAALLGAGGIGAGGYFGFRRLLTPTALLRPEEKHKLAQVNSLLVRKQELEVQLNDVEQDRLRKVALEARLKGLRAKMESVDPALYQTRIEKLAAAEATVSEQIGLDDRLIDGYRRSIAMLEIEVEASAHVGELPDDVAEVLRAKAEQLAAIRDQNRELENLLAANQEVDRLLRGS